jgi:homoserine O-succinyltransferase/O-acetyltransferase
MPVELHSRDEGPFGLRRTGSSKRVRIALVNNMPDSALEDTETQFIELLEASSAGLVVELTLFSIPTVPRGERAQERINKVYRNLPELLCSRFDGVIVTGTEPRQSDLRDEPYWNDLAAVFDWAEEFSRSTILSCLAAHAGVLQGDGLVRRRLEDKRFGVFTEAKVKAHFLTDSVNDPVCFPHSRWNDLPAEELVARGYTILTQAEDGGVGLFVKQRKNSLFAHFQGHPEYTTQTLLKEYRRDVKRFLTRERETYPSLPVGYFDRNSETMLKSFRDEATESRKEALMEKFPGQLAGKALHAAWSIFSIEIFNNWLYYIHSTHAGTATKASVQTVGS